MSSTRIAKEHRDKHPRSTTAKRTSVSGRVNKAETKDTDQDYPFICGYSMWTNDENGVRR